MNKKFIALFILTIFIGTTIISANAGFDVVDSKTQNTDKEMQKDLFDRYIRILMKLFQLQSLELIVG